MERISDAIGMLDLMIRPGFFVKEDKIVKVLSWIAALTHNNSPFKNTPGQYMQIPLKIVPYFLDSIKKIG